MTPAGLTPLILIFLETLILMFIVTLVYSWLGGRAGGTLGALTTAGMEEAQKHSVCYIYVITSLHAQWLSLDTR